MIKYFLAFSLSLFFIQPAYAEVGQPVSTGLEEVPPVALDKPLIEDPGDVVDSFGLIVSAFKDGRYFFAIGLILMVLLWVFNKIVKDKVPKKYLKIIAIVLPGIAGAAMYWMQAPVGVAWYSSLLQGLIAGVGVGCSAIGAHQLAGKKILKSNAPS